METCIFEGDCEYDEGPNGYRAKGCKQNIFISKDATDYDKQCTPLNITKCPTSAPTTSPSTSPTTQSPSTSPTKKPTTSSPSKSPTKKPTTSSPTTSPTTKSPSKAPTKKPTTSSPTTSSPTDTPTASPTPACDCPVLYEGQCYKTLLRDDIGPDTEVIECETNNDPQPIPPGWDIAPNLPNSEDVANNFPWGSVYLLGKDDKRWITKDINITECDGSDADIPCIFKNGCNIINNDTSHCQINILITKPAEPKDEQCAPINMAKCPTSAPTTNPTTSPTTQSPSTSPTKKPTTSSPTKSPTKKPTTSSPTTSPTTKSPSKAPTKKPTTSSPTTSSPTDTPTTSPTEEHCDCKVLYKGKCYSTLKKVNPENETIPECTDPEPILLPQDWMIAEKTKDAVFISNSFPWGAAINVFKPDGNDAFSATLGIFLIFSLFSFLSITK